MTPTYPIDHPTPEQVAKEIVRTVENRNPARSLDDHTAKLELIESFATALCNAAKVGEGCVRDDKGVERKVLGTLPVTADGCVIGFGEQAVMYAGASARVYSNIGFADEPRPDHWTRNWYSTPEAAQRGAGAER